MLNPSAGGRRARHRYYHLARWIALADATDPTDALPRADRRLLVTENNYRHRLFNVDIGVYFRDVSGTPEG